MDELSAPELNFIFKKRWNFGYSMCNPRSLTFVKVFSLFDRLFFINTKIDYVLAKYNDVVSNIKNGGIKITEVYNELAVKVSNKKDGGMKVTEIYDELAVKVLWGVNELRVIFFGTNEEKNGEEKTDAANLGFPHDIIQPEHIISITPSTPTTAFAWEAKQTSDETTSSPHTTNVKHDPAAAAAAAASESSFLLTQNWANPNRKLGCLCIDCT